MSIYSFCHNVFNSIKYLNSLLEIIHIFAQHRYFQSHLMQICCMWDRVKRVTVWDIWLFGRIALAIPVYRLAMSVRLSVHLSVCLSDNILVKVSGWGKISALERVTNLILSLKVSSNRFYWFLWLLWPWHWFVNFQGQIANNPALPSSAVSCFTMFPMVYQMFINESLTVAWWINSKVRLVYLCM